MTGRQHQDLGAIRQARRRDRPAEPDERPVDPGTAHYAPGWTPPEPDRDVLDAAAATVRRITAGARPDADDGPLMLLPLVVTRSSCPVHGAEPGESCWLVQTDYGPMPTACAARIASVPARPVRKHPATAGRVGQELGRVGQHRAPNRVPPKGWQGQFPNPTGADR